MTRSTRGMLWLALAGATAAAVPVPVQAQGADGALPAAREVFDRFVAAIGGRQAVLRLTSSRSTVTTRAPDGAVSEGEFLNLAPNLAWSRMRVRGSEILSGYDGTIGWSVEEGTARLLTGSELADMAEESIFYRILHDDSLFRSAQTVEAREVDGRRCWYVRMVWRSGRETGECFDQQTGLRVLAEYSLKVGEGERIPLVEVHGEYRDYGGVLSPSVIRTRVMGMDLVTTVTSVRYGGVDPVALAPPAEVRALAAGSQRP
ncbi:MAG TPA: hypothetical protein VFT45_01950 [Longimicrobium sp.]|nr:hypothetical protein [Longimicrobium sp.]